MSAPVHRTRLGSTTSTWHANILLTGLSLSLFLTPNPFLRNCLSSEACQWPPGVGSLSGGRRSNSDICAQAASPDFSAQDPVLEDFHS